MLTAEEIVALHDIVDEFESAGYYISSTNHQVQMKNMFESFAAAWWSCSPSLDEPTHVVSWLRHTASDLLDCASWSTCHTG